MSLKEFYTLYWEQYLKLEKEFMNTFDYVTFSPDNFKVYSSKYISLMLQIGSEADIGFKILCKLKGKCGNNDSINTYFKSMQKNYIQIFDDEIIVEKLKLNLKPYAKWFMRKDNLIHNMFWWTSYNKIKHSRSSIVTIDGNKYDTYKLANLENCLNGLAVLYDVLVNIYLHIKESETPNDEYCIPKSLIFKFKNDCIDESKIYKGFIIFDNDISRMEVHYAERY